MLPQLSKPGATAALHGLSQAFEPGTAGKSTLSVGEGAGEEGLNSFAFLLRAGTALPRQPAPFDAAQDMAAAGEELAVASAPPLVGLAALAGQLAAELPAAGETAPAEAGAAAAPSVLPLAPAMAGPVPEAGDAGEEETAGEEAAERRADAEAESEAQGRAQSQAQAEAAGGSPLKDGVPAAAADLTPPAPPAPSEEGEGPASSGRDNQGGNDRDTTGERNPQNNQASAEVVSSGAAQGEAPQEEADDAFRSEGPTAPVVSPSKASSETAGEAARSGQDSTEVAASGPGAPVLATATAVEIAAAQARRSEPGETPVRGAASPAGGNGPAASAKPGGEVRPEAAGPGKTLAEGRGADSGRSGPVPAPTNAPANAPTAAPSPEANAGLATARAAAFLEALGNARGKSTSGAPGGSESLGPLTAAGEAAAARGLAPGQAGPADVRPAGPGLLADQVAVHIRSGAAAGLQRMTLQLNPAEMGRLDIRLEFTSDGTLRALISAERPEAMEVLQRDSRGLERMLADAGIKTDSQSLSFDLREQNQQRDRMDQQARGEQNGEQRDRNAKEDPGNPTHQPPPAHYRGLINLSV